jgi:hypothetical protein
MTGETAAPSMTWAEIRALRPCADRWTGVRRKLNATFPDYLFRRLTMADARAAGVEFDDLIWIAARADERRTRLFAADCAARVSHLMPDPRSHAAIVAARQFARGEIDVGQMAAAGAAEVAGAAGAAARAAARAAAPSAAWSVVWFAPRDAAWAAGAVAETSHWTTWAAARDAEQQWQLGRLVAWFSAEEPEDWPIAAPAAPVAT